MVPARVNVAVTSVWRHPDDAAAPDTAIIRARADAAQWVHSLDSDARLALETRLDTQALLGEPVLIVKEVDDWAQVRLPWQPSSRSLDGYPGWIPSAHLLHGRGDLPSRPADGAVMVLIMLSTSF